MKRGEPVDVVIMVGASVDDLTRQGRVRAGGKVDLARRYGADEGMVLTITGDYASRMRSCELLAEAFA